MTQTDPSPGPAHAHHSDRELAGMLMRRQAGLSLRAAAVFLVLILGFPLLCHYAPDVAQRRVAGFPLTWLFMGLLFYGVTWVLSWWFVQASERLEAADTALVREERPEAVEAALRRHAEGKR